MNEDSTNYRARQAYRAMQSEQSAQGTGGFIALLGAVVIAAAMWWLTRWTPAACAGALLGAVAGYFLGYRLSRLINLLFTCAVIVVITLVVIGGLSSANNSSMGNSTTGNSSPNNSSANSPETPAAPEAASESAPPADAQTQAVVY